MSIVLTYKSALEAMRQSAFAELVHTWDKRTGYVPAKLPSAEDLERIVAENPLLQALSKPLHLLVSSDDNSHSCKRVVRHVTRVKQPRDAFVRIGEEVYVSSPELLPFQMARICSVCEEALLMSELCGRYAITPQAVEGMEQRRCTLTTRAELRDFLSRRESGYGVRTVREALKLSCDDSGSPFESKLALRFRGEPNRGGYQLDFVSMNEEISLRPIGDALDAKQIRKPDILFLAPPSAGPESSMPFRGIAVDYKGKVHDDPRVAAADDTRRNELLAHGIKTYEIRKCHYDDIGYMDDFVERLMSDLGRPACDLTFGREKRLQLWRELERIDCVHWSRDRGL